MKTVQGSWKLTPERAMTDGKLNQTAQRQQEDRKKRLADALRANMALRKNRGRSVPVPEQLPASDDTASADDQSN